MSLGPDGQRRLDGLLRFSYLCFLFSTPWSIAASQISLEFCILFFLLIIITTGYNPFTRSLRMFYIAVAVWWVWLIVSALAGPTPGQSLLASRGEWLLVAVPIGIYLIRNRRDVAVMFTVLASGMLLVSIQGLAQYFFGVGWLASQPPEPAPAFGYRVAGAFSGYVTFASFFAIGSTALVGFVVGNGKQLTAGQRRVMVVAAVVAGVLTILTFERMAFAALLAGITFVLLIAGRRLWIWALIVVLASVMAVSAVPRARAWFVDSVTAERELRDSSRRFIWRATFRLIEEHPLFGVGKGNFRAEYETVVRPNLLEKKKVSTAHNDFLHFAAILGIPGAVLYLFLWVVVFRYFMRGFLRGRDGPLLAAIGGSVCLLLMSMFHCVFVDAEIRALLMFLWAVGLAEWYNVDAREGDSKGQLSA